MLQTQRLLCFRKSCPCLLLRGGYFCVSKIVSEIKRIKSGKLFLKQKIYPSAGLSRTNESVSETESCPCAPGFIKFLVFMCLEFDLSVYKMLWNLYWAYSNSINFVIYQG